MLRYSSGLRKRVICQRERLRFASKRMWAVLTRYPVFRPRVDHTVYESDNKYLGTTSGERAFMEHRVSCTHPISKPALIEFEHGFALFGHLDEKTDYVRFRQSLPKKLRVFFGWFNPEIHRLCATSFKARDMFRSMCRDHGYDLPESACEVLRWGFPKRRSVVRPPSGKLRVFHYGGFHPFSKGTGDVFALAKLFPSVSFEVSVDLNHPFVRKNVPPNVNLYPVESKARYNAAMKKCHILVYPVYGDGWGVGLECMSLAMPIIVYNSYDKSEMVSDNSTGYVVRIPEHLSFYDGFMESPCRNWTEFGEYISADDNSDRVALLASALENYCRSTRTLMEHSRAAAVRLEKYHDPLIRIRRIKEIYAEILSNVNKAG